MINSVCETGGKKKAGYGKGEMERKAMVKMSWARREGVLLSYHYLLKFHVPQPICFTIKKDYSKHE